MNTDAVVGYEGHARFDEQQDMRGIVCGYLIMCRCWTEVVPSHSDNVAGKVDGYHHQRGNSHRVCGETRRRGGTNTERGGRLCSRVKMQHAGPRIDGESDEEAVRL